MSVVRRGCVLALLVAVASCRGADDCTLGDPFELRITATSIVSGESLNELSGFTRTGQSQHSLHCSPADEQRTCFGQVSGLQSDVHLERAGYLPWDTTNVRAIRGGTGCGYTTEKHLEVEMVPVGG